MVALQILVLTVGVRILLGEKAARRGFLFWELQGDFQNVCEFCPRIILRTRQSAWKITKWFMAPSNIGLVHRPLKAERWVRLPLELKQNLSEKRSNALDFRAERTPARRLFFLDNNIAVSVLSEYRQYNRRHGFCKDKCPCSLHRKYLEELHKFLTKTQSKQAKSIKTFSLTFFIYSIFYYDWMDFAFRRRDNDGVHIQGCSPLEQSVTLTLRPSANDFIASNMPFWKSL